MKRTNAGKSAICAVAISLTLCLLLLANLLPTSKLFLLGVSSVATSVVALECGRGWGWLFYIGTSALALWLLPLGGPTFFYLLFFGYWGLLREKFAGPKYLILLFKLLYFNFLLFVLYWVAKASGLVPEISQARLLLLWLGSQFVLLIYDWAYELALDWIKARFQTK